MSIAQQGGGRASSRASSRNEAAMRDSSRDRERRQHQCSLRQARREQQAAVGDCWCRRQGLLPRWRLFCGWLRRRRRGDVAVDLRQSGRRACQRQLTLLRARLRRRPVAAAAREGAPSRGSGAAGAARRAPDLAGRRTRRPAHGAARRGHPHDRRSTGIRGEHALVRQHALRPLAAATAGKTVAAAVVPIADATAAPRKRPRRRRSDCQLQLPRHCT